MRVLARRYLWGVRGRISRRDPDRSTCIYL